jgi:hypothetical protein
MSFLVVDRVASEHFTFPGLARPLIRRHDFFGGIATPFRTEPIEATRALGVR